MASTSRRLKASTARRIRSIPSCDIALVVSPPKVLLSMQSGQPLLVQSGGCALHGNRHSVDEEKLRRRLPRRTSRSFRDHFRGFPPIVSLLVRLPFSIVVSRRRGCLLSALKL